jgi:hypothetical protein
VVLCDLAAEDEADAGAIGFGRKEGDEEIGVARQAGTAVDDADLGKIAVAAPLDLYVPAGFGYSLDGVLDEVDQKLLKLRGVGFDGEVGAGLDADGGGLLQLGDMLDAFAQLDGLESRRREFLRGRSRRVRVSSPRTRRSMSEGCHPAGSRSGSAGSFHGAGRRRVRFGCERC